MFVGAMVPLYRRENADDHTRTFKTFYGVLKFAARWLTEQQVTHVAMEATGIYSMPVYHALIEHGQFEKVLVCNPQPEQTPDNQIRLHRVASPCPVTIDSRTSSQVMFSA
jgi:hypothetical protein